MVMDIEDIWNIREHTREDVKRMNKDERNAYTFLKADAESFKLLTGVIKVYPK
jgi:hypothetical protein